jgi:hypothetical protein
MGRFFDLKWGRFSPFFIQHTLFRFNFSLLISIRNILLSDKIQKQGLQEEVHTKSESFCEVEY